MYGATRRIEEGGVISFLGVGEDLRFLISFPIEDEDFISLTGRREFSGGVEFEGGGDVRKTGFEEGFSGGKIDPAEGSGVVTEEEIATVLRK